ncbi:MAG: hypothetical protein M0D57_08250 [Sphingobacteriales bacterium JAD_PAG50586_3]|nr:MAG: hypothetical protein M0D57_08250 [Sphingobacteriales bacterium JAD_PAG50586_3]
MNEKRALIIKADSDVCGHEIGMVENHFRFLGLQVYSESISKEQGLDSIVRKYADIQMYFDYIYLCAHGNKYGFNINIEDVAKSTVPWFTFSELMCENDILNHETIFLIACCKGGLFRVATDIMAICNKINFVCGVDCKVRGWDLTTGFVVFIHHVESNQASPTYAAEKATLATNFPFVCHDRDNIEVLPQYEKRQTELYKQLGWVNDEDEWVEQDPKIKENAGVM